MQILEPTFDVAFGVLNIKGLMTAKDTVIEQPNYTHDVTIEYPVFAHPTYTVTTTLDSKYNKDYGLLKYKPAVENKLCEGQSYQKLYRKSVRWDFGDGTVIEGYSATHAYSTPGKYTISCIFYDVNRQGIQNGYTIKVIVKQVIPTQLAFVVNQSNITSIPCSKIEKIAQIEGLLSDNVKESVDVIAERIYEPKQTHGQDWDDIKDAPYPQLERYTCFLEKKEEYYNHTEDIYKEHLVPTKVFHPEWEDMYGYFSVSGNNIVFNCYRVVPYASAPKMPNLQILNPNASILETDNFITTGVTNVSTIDELPEAAVYSGKRAFFDIYYKSDYISAKNVISIHFDADNINFHNSIDSSTNFLNIAPLGMHFAIVANDFSKVNWSITLNGFVTSYTPVDKLVELSMIQDFSFTGILIPYFKSPYNNYYIPKDFAFNQYEVTTSFGNFNTSQVQVLSTDAQYYKNLRFTLNDVLDGTLTITQGTTQITTIPLTYKLKDFDSMIVPREKYYNQDVQRLINVYTPHPLFQETPNLKQALFDIFTHKNVLDYILTKGMHFFDDTTNTDTCYVTYLLSKLKMMGETVYEYDTTTFEGVNELRDICRILTMNHSQLVGNHINKAYDITYNESHKGDNVGDEIFVTDKLLVVMNNQVVGDTRFQKGKIVKFERDGKLYNLKEPTVLIIRDNYTNETRTVTFSGLTPKEMSGDYGVFYIQDYTENWQWGLLLPDEVDVKTTDLSGKLLSDKGNVMTSYYSFYLLNTYVDKQYVNNFLEESTITPEVTDLATWEKLDGHTFDLVQKVTYEAADVMDE